MLPRCLRLASALGRRVKFRVEGVEVFGVKFFLQGAQRFPKPLEVNHFPRPQETDGIGHFRHVFHHPQNVVVSGTRFLLGGQVFK